MAKRLLGILLITIISVFVTKAQESLLVYDGIIPSAGSEISSFDFVLKFDLSKVTESNGDGNYGIGWVGYHNDNRPEKEKSITIYKGNPSDGIVIGRVCNSNYHGGSVGFTENSDIEISIEGAIPESGVTYTMVINNEFKVFEIGKATPVANAVFDCFTNPVTYTFVGGVPSGDKLAILECSISANQSIETLSEIVFNFNQPVTVNPDFSVEVKEGEVIYSSSKDFILSEDKTSVTYKFDNVPLLLNHSYVITLPNGAVSSVGNSSDTNSVFNIPVTGNYVGYFNLVSSTPTPEEKTIFTTIEGIFDMPEGFQIYKKPEYALNLSALLYKNEVSEENLVGTIDGVYNSEKNGIVWTNSHSLEPETKYILYKSARDFRAYEIATDKFSNDWYNGEVQVVLNTPSIEESGLTPMEWGEPVIGTHGTSSAITLKEGEKYATLPNIEVALKDLNYYGFEGKKLSIFNDVLSATSQNPKAYLYDVTDGEPKLVKEVSASVGMRENATDYYNVAYSILHSTLYEGHKYRFVLPEGTFAVSLPLLFKFLRTPELSVEFYGSTPSSVQLESCSLEEGAELSELFNVVWAFKGEFEFNPEAKAKLAYKSDAGGGGTTAYLLTSVALNGTTRLVAHIYNGITGSALSLRPNTNYTLTVPEGAIYYSADPNIKSKEMVINFRGIEAAPDIKEPEFVNVVVAVDGIHTSTIEGVKGRSAKIQIAPDEYWEVTALTRDDNDVLPFLEDGAYETPALEADTHIKATIGYKGLVINDNPAEVVEITDSNAKVYSHGDVIIVEGLNAGDNVAVYTTGGIVIANETVKAGVNSMSFKVRNGEVYLVRVNDKAAKIRH